MSHSTAGAVSNSGRIPARAGIGLRHVHHRDILDGKPRVGFLEVHAENYFGGGAPVHFLDRLAQEYPISLHAVGMSLVTDGPRDRGHLACIKALAERVEAPLVSEHLSWCMIDGIYLNDLLPLPYTEESLAIVTAHIDEMQMTLGREVLIENPSSYLQFTHSTMPEWEYLNEVARVTGCFLLLDVNNIYVSAMNHGFDAGAYLDAVSAGAVREIHLAGHHVKEVGGTSLRIDDHGSAVAPAVWALFERAVRRFGPVPTLIEWDSNIPSLSELVDEARKADRFRAAVAKECPHAVVA
jgi:uncharacterized protein (UPF0276 family)